MRERLINQGQHRKTVRSLQRCWDALANGFATAELFHQPRDDRRGCGANLVSTFRDEVLSGLKRDRVFMIRRGGKR
jgi:hypothetical protein